MKDRRCSCHDCQYCKGRDRYEKDFPKIQARNKRFSAIKTAERNRIKNANTEDLMREFYYD